MKRIAAILAAAALAYAPSAAFAAAVDDAQANAMASASCIDLAKDLVSGDKGEAVLALQRFLVSESLLDASVAGGTFGTKTRLAIKEYQKGQGIAPANGKVGRLTRAAIRRATCGRPSVLGDHGVSFGTVAFDLSPVPLRTGEKEEPKEHVVFSATTKEVIDRGTVFTLSVESREINSQVEFWEMDFKCGKNVTVEAGAGDLCGGTFTRFGFNVPNPLAGFELASVLVAPKGKAQGRVDVTLTAVDADGEVLDDAVRVLRVPGISKR